MDTTKKAPQTVEEFEQARKQVTDDVHETERMTKEMHALVVQFQKSALDRMTPVENIKSTLNGSKIEASRTKGGFIIIGFEKQEIMKDFFKWLKNGGNFSS